MFPTPWTIRVHEAIDGTKDAHGNPRRTYVPRAELDPVYGWAPPSTGRNTEPFEANRNAIQADLEVYTPTTFTCKPTDRVEVDGLMYEVVGRVEDFNHGPFGFAPGNRVSLKRFTEGG